MMLDSQFRRRRESEWIVARFSATLLKIAQLFKYFRHEVAGEPSDEARNMVSDSGISFNGIIRYSQFDSSRMHN
jgi:hypothetical protein